MIVGGEGEILVDREGIVGLKDSLGTVVELAVADQQTKAAGCEEVAVCCGKAIDGAADADSATKTQPFVFLVTDGAQDPQTKALNQSGGWAGSNHATVIDPTKECKTIKGRGIIISVLYIPYQPIQNPNPSFAGDEDDYANNNIKNIPPSLQGCASPNFFFTANTPADITTALNAMFNMALKTAHITN